MEFEQTHKISKITVTYGGAQGVEPGHLHAELQVSQEFKDAIASLSPEQQQFAKAFRAMQLEPCRKLLLRRIVFNILSLSLALSLT